MGYQMFDVIVRVSLEDSEVPPLKDDGDFDYQAFRTIAKDALDTDEIYDIREV